MRLINCPTKCMPENSALIVDKCLYHGSCARMQMPVSRMAIARMRMLVANKCMYHGSGCPYADARITDGYCPYSDAYCR